MILKDPKTGKFLSAKESKKIVDAKKAEYDKTINSKHKDELKTTKIQTIVKTCIIIVAGFTIGYICASIVDNLFSL